VLLLLGIFFAAGVVTAISPCVLPVLPIVLAGGASGGERRPYAIVGGLVASFTVFTLATTWILSKLGLPQDFLRDLALVLLFVLAASLVVPQLGRLLERPFLRFSRRGGGDLGGGFLLGASLGLVFVPCAGPVLTYITVKAASMDVGARTVALTFAYSLGAALPMLLIARGGQRASRRLRPHALRLRTGLGLLMALGALAIVFGLDVKLQRSLGDYTGFLQSKVERNAYARRELRPRARAAGLGPAPAFQGISHWLNTPGERPLSPARLRGKVVLIDFWTYSCINCLRTLPHVEAWDARYRRDGLVVVGVHTPEFAFEHVLSNVRGATRRYGVRYPVALDNRYATWNAYANQYWPAEYLIDRRGRIRHEHFGEGQYAETEALIRRLLAERAHVRLPPASGLADATPTDLVTPESYLGYQRLARYAGSAIVPRRPASYRFSRELPQNELSYSGTWTVGPERIVAGRGARLRLHFHARNVYLVLGGRGGVETRVDGKRTRRVRVTGDRLYTLLALPRVEDGTLELRFAPGVSAYAFTFG
jgi:cytochrome c biogenesis protein CcdA/thiol-disulfide isomerase/thioredoxin